MIGARRTRIRDVAANLEINHLRRRVGKTWSSDDDGIGSKT